jgi:acetolactate synthase-1/3 small subunit
MDKIQPFTISVFTENRPGLLARVTIVLTRRRLNIESITVSESEVPGVHRYTLVLRTTRDAAEKATAQVNKLVDVLKAFVHPEQQILSRELALYKLNAQTIDQLVAEKLVRHHQAAITYRDEHFLVIEKTGSRPETELLRLALESFGVLEFARSGQVTITKPMKELRTYLAELE